MDEVLRAVYGCALMACSFQWHLFMAREDRGRGHVESAAAHIRKAQELSDELWRQFVAHGWRGSDG